MLYPYERGWLLLQPPYLHVVDSSLDTFNRYFVHNNIHLRTFAHKKEKKWNIYNTEKYFLAFLVFGWDLGRQILPTIAMEGSFSSLEGLYLKMMIFL